LDFWEVVSNKKSSKTGMAFQNKIIILLKPLQMFLPFEYDTKSNETFFDKVSNGKMKLFVNRVNQKRYYLLVLFTVIQFI
jgi:hypothetical protein